MADFNFATLFQHETDLLEVAARQALFQEGDGMNDTVYVLISGAAEIRVGGKVVEHAEPGALLGEMAMIDEGVRSATVVATVPSRFVAIGRARFNFLIQQTPNFALAVMRVIANRLRATDRVFGTPGENL